ncbi:MAG TPA: hypothetical protein PKV21_07140, partial [bacterium]|nr:hypothetical protein [bacterium]
IEVDFEKEKEFNLIQFIFDADTDKEYTHIPPFYIPPAIPEEFRIYAQKDGKWEKILEIKGNTNYFCRYKFKKVKSRKIKVEFLKTIGESPVYVYEMRVYNVK